MTTLEPVSSNAPAPVLTTAPDPRLSATKRRMTPGWRAWLELVAGARAWRVWTMLAWDDVRSRYRRTKLGPLWLTLSHAITITGLALSFSVIMNQPLNYYFVYLTAGLTVWAFLSSTIIDAPVVFIRGRPLIEGYDMPASIHVFRMVLSQLIAFGHHLGIYVFALLFVQNTANWTTLLAIPAILILCIAASGWGMLLGLLGARFRDLAHAIGSAMSLLFMLTPIFWQRDLLRQHAWIAEINPIYHLITIVRDPLLGRAPSLTHWLVSIGIALAAVIVGVAFYVRARRQLTYWL